ncbi:MAG: hypothetical protein WDW38_001496 [Sanguina aurantia]
MLQAKWNTLCATFKGNTQSSAELLMRQAAATAQLEELVQQLFLQVRSGQESDARLSAQLLSERTESAAKLQEMGNSCSTSHHRSTALQVVQESLQGQLQGLQQQIERLEQSGAEAQEQVDMLTEQLQAEQSTSHGQRHQLDVSKQHMEEMGERLELQVSANSELQCGRAELQQQLKRMVRAEGELMENLRLTHTAIEQQLVMLRGQVKAERSKNMQLARRNSDASRHVLLLTSQLRALERPQPPPLQSAGSSPRPSPARTQAAMRQLRGSSGRLIAHSRLASTARVGRTHPAANPPPTTLGRPATATSSPHAAAQTTHQPRCSSPSPSPSPSYNTPLPHGPSPSSHPQHPTSQPSPRNSRPGSGPRATSPAASRHPYHSSNTTTPEPAGLAQRRLASPSPSRPSPSQPLSAGRTASRQRSQSPSPSLPLTSPRPLQPQQQQQREQQQASSVSPVTRNSAPSLHQHPTRVPNRPAVGHPHTSQHAQVVPHNGSGPAPSAAAAAGAASAVAAAAAAAEDGAGHVGNPGTEAAGQAAPPVQGSGAARASPSAAATAAAAAREAQQDAVQASRRQSLEGQQGARGGRVSGSGAAGGLVAGNWLP